MAGLPNYIQGATHAGLAAAQEAIAESADAQAALDFVKDKAKMLSDAAPVVSGQAADWYATEVAPRVQLAVDVIKEKGAEAFAAAPGVAEGAGTFIKEEGAKVKQAAPDAADKALQWAAKNPGKTACLVAGGVMGAAPMAVAAPVLGAIGLGGLGPVAGAYSITHSLMDHILTGLERIIGGMFAGAQAGGLVSAGGFLATLQSAAAGGYGVAAVSAAVQGVGAALGGIAGGLAFMENKEEGADEEVKEDQ